MPTIGTIEMITCAGADVIISFMKNSKEKVFVYLDRQPYKRLQKLFKICKFRKINVLNFI